MSSPSIQAQSAFGPSVCRFASLFIACVFFAACASGVCAGTPPVYPQTVEIEGNASGELCNAAFSADGRLLATASQDGRVVVWDAADGSRLTVFDEHKHGGGYFHVPLQFLDGDVIASTAEKNAVYVWEARTGKVVHEIKAGSEVRAFAVSPDKSLMVVLRTGQPPLVVGMSDGKEIATLKGFDGDVDRVLFRPDSRSCLTASTSKRSDFDQTVRMWDLPSGKHKQRIGGTVAVRNWLLSADGSVLTMLNSDGYLTQHRLSDGGQILSFTKEGLVPGSVERMFFYEDESRICIDNGQEFSLWDLKAKKRLSAPLVDEGEGESTDHRHPALDPSGKMCVVAGFDGVLRFYTPAFAKQVFSIVENNENNNRRATLCIFSPDGQRLAAMWRNRTATVFSLSDRLRIAMADSGRSSPIEAAVASSSPAAPAMAATALQHDAKSLIVTQNQTAKAASPDKETLSAEEALRLAQRDAPLDLSHFTTISDDAAKAIAHHRGLLSLDGLTALSTDGAKALAEHRGSISFDGLTSLPVDVAGALSQCKGGLSFGGLTQVTDDAAFMLSKCKGVSLGLDGVTTLSASAAKALSQYRGSLSLNGLTTLSDEAALALGQFRGTSLSLKRLTTLPDEAAIRLSQHTDATIFLDGITTLSSKAAAALKSHPYASLPDKFSIQPEMPAGPAPASVALQRKNTDAVPQRPSPWVESIAKNPDLNARVVLAIGKLLGPSTDTFSGDSFKGIRLGDAYDTTTIPENARIMCDWPAPAPAANQAGGRDAEMTVLVAKDTAKIVGISAYYREPFQQIVGDLVAVFGKTPQKPETFRAFAGEFPITITVVKYTCPKTIVRVISREGPQGSLGVSINVFDKEFVLESLRRYANSVAVSCDWLAAVVEGIADPDKPLGQISPLADCAADADARSRVLLWFDEQQREGYRRGHKAKEFGPYVPRAFDVAGAFTTADTGAAIVDTMVSGSLGVPYLCSRSVDSQGLQCTIASTAVADMFWDVASSLAQSRFPPADKNISVIRPHPDSPEGFAASMADRSGNVISSIDPDASPTERMQLFEKRVSGDRYEWMDKNGYRVRVGSNLAISVEKPLQAPRRGL